MNNETLKRDLCARLMEGVKMVNKEVNKTYFNPLILKGFRDEDSIYLHGLSLPQKLSNYAPILFPTSALTKEIQIANYNNGEPFVPIDLINDELNKRITCDVTILFNYYFYNYRIFLCRGEHDYYEEVEIWNDENHFLNCPIWIVDLLKKWHINYRLSPEQFIEVTDEFNPYK